MLKTVRRCNNIKIMFARCIKRSPLFSTVKNYRATFPLLFLTARKQILTSLNSWTVTKKYSNYFLNNTVLQKQDFQLNMCEFRSFTNILISKKVLSSFSVHCSISSFKSILYKKLTFIREAQTIHR